MMREVLTRRFKRLIDEAPRGNRQFQNGGTGADIAAPSPLAPLPSPLAGEGGEDRRSEPGEGAMAVGVAVEASPSPARASLGHPLPQGERMTEPAERVGEPTESPAPQDESDEPAESPWPDLVLIDGGRGQLTAAHETLAALGLADVPLVGIAKGPDRDAGMETFFVPGREPFKLKPRDPVLYFVQRLRDEAHRFAVGSHRARRRRDIREAGLQEIPGVGPTRKRALLHHFGTLKAIERAAPADLAKVPGISAETARKIYDFFHEGAGQRGPALRD